MDKYATVEVIMNYIVSPRQCMARHFFGFLSGRSSLLSVGLQFLTDINQFRSRVSISNLLTLRSGK